MAKAKGEIVRIHQADIRQMKRLLAGDFIPIAPINFAADVILARRRTAKPAKKPPAPKPSRTQGYQPTDPASVNLRHPPAWLPSPSEITAACEQIQTTWTRVERRQRLVGPGPRPTIPTVAERHLIPEADEQ